MTDLYAVIGNPIAHSKSPQIHAAFARQTGQDLRYERILAPLEDFAAAVADFRAAGGRGLNITLPFKEEAFDLAGERSRRASAAGAANTLSFKDGRAVADNTDGAGLVRDLLVNHQFDLTAKRILLMGAGGAARGVIGPLLAAAPATLIVANRSLDKALALAQRFGIAAHAYADLPGSSFDLVINATSASLNADLPPIAPEALDGSFAYDMMYGAGDTLFMAHARRQGATRVADGLGMLVEQAAESFHVWRGIRPETRSILEEIRNGLNGGAA
jgi:shikimate dehydrogenase